MSYQDDDLGSTMVCAGYWLPHLRSRFEPAVRADGDDDLARLEDVRRLRPLLDVVPAKLERRLP